MAAEGHEVAKGFVTLMPSLQGFKKETSKQLAEPLEKAGHEGGRRFGGAFLRTSAGPFRGIAQIAGGPLLAGFAAVASVNVFGGFIAQARESNRIAAETAQVIKTTGGAANVTAAQVSALATSISNKTGVDDEAIQSASNLLLTFTNVRNEVGKGNDIFNQATQAATDMAAVLGGDASSQAIQLGKALNDPTKGITALSRAGVSFTAQQVAQIKAMQASGNVLGAQKIILKELGHEFGGAAAAAATPMDKLKVTLGNVAENIGNLLIPAIDKGATFLNAKILPAVMAFTSGLGDHAGPVIKAVSGFVQTTLLPAFQRIGQFLTTTFLPVVRTWVAVFREHVLPVITQVAGWLASTLLPALVQIWSHIFTKLQPVFQSLANFIQTSVLPAAAGLWARFQKVLPTLEAVYLVVEKVIGFLLELVATILAKVVPVIVGVLGPIFKAAFAILGAGIGIIAGIIGAFGHFRDAIGAVGRFFSSIASGIKAGFLDLVNFVIDRINDIIGTINHLDGISVLGHRLGAPKLGKLGHVGDGSSRPSTNPGLTTGRAVLANGGITTGPTNALIGEGGEAEMVLPLSKAKQMGFGGDDEIKGLLRDIRDGQMKAAAASGQAFGRELNGVAARGQSKRRALGVRLA